MKKIIPIILFLGFVATAVAAQSAFQKREEAKQSPKEFSTITTATTTYSGPAKRFTHYLDSQFTGQGVCIAIRDIDGGGITYLTTLNGVATFSVNSCE